MTYNLIHNSRPGRSAAVLHVADIGCPALAQAKNTSDLGETDTLEETLRRTEVISSQFKAITVCRKCRSAARQILAIQKRRTEKFILLTPFKVTSSWADAVEMAQDFTDASSDGITYWAAENARGQHFVGMTQSLGHHRPQYKIRMDKVRPATPKTVKKAPAALA